NNAGNAAASEMQPNTPTEMVKENLANRKEIRNGTTKAPRPKKTLPRLLAAAGFEVLRAGSRVLPPEFTQLPPTPNNAEATKTPLAFLAIANRHMANPTRRKPVINMGL